MNNGEPLLELAGVLNQWYRDVGIQIIATKCQQIYIIKMPPRTISHAPDRSADNVRTAILGTVTSSANSRLKIVPLDSRALILQSKSKAMSKANLGMSPLHRRYAHDARISAMSPRCDR
jgi:hypothetical protein